MLHVQRELAENTCSSEAGRDPSVWGCILTQISTINAMGGAYAVGVLYWHLKETFSIYARSQDHTPF